jgi:hypothetical protein
MSQFRQWGAPGSLPPGSNSHERVVGIQPKMLLTSAANMRLPASAAFPLAALPGPLEHNSSAAQHHELRDRLHAVTRFGDDLRERTVVHVQGLVHRRKRGFGVATAALYRKVVLFCPACGR